MLEEIEREYREIFSRDRITQIAMKRAAYLLSQWKLITGYVSDKSNPILEDADVLDHAIKQTL